MARVNLEETYKKLMEAEDTIIGEIEEVTDPSDSLIPQEDEEKEEFNPRTLASNFVEEVRNVFELSLIHI